MSSSQYLSVFVCMLGLAVGNLLFKKTATTIDMVSSTFWGLFGNGWFYLALSVYGCATLFWIWLLRKTPLTLAYPVFALGFVVVPILDHLYFKESLRFSTLIGGGIIVIGVIVATRGA